MMLVIWACNLKASSDTDCAMKSAHKTLLLVLGVLVAAAILAASVYFKDTAFVKEKTGKALPTQKVEPAALLLKVLDKIPHKAKF